MEKIRKKHANQTRYQLDKQDFEKKKHAKTCVNWKRYANKIRNMFLHMHFSCICDLLCFFFALRSCTCMFLYIFDFALHGACFQDCGFLE